MKRSSLIAIISIFYVTALYAGNTNKTTVKIVPYASIPAGSSINLLNSGFGGRISASFIPGATEYLGLQTGLDYLWIPMKTADSVQLYSVFLGSEVSFLLGKYFNLSIYGNGGYFFWNPVGWDAKGGNGGGFSFDTGTQISFLITPSLGVSIGGSYSYYSNFYNGYNLSLSLGWISHTKRKEPVIKLKPELKLLDMKVPTLYPVLYKYYDKHPLGSVDLKNNYRSTVDNIRVRFFVDSYMANPMVTEEAISIKPGETKKVDLYALFTNDVMEITEGTKVSAEITISYQVKGKDKKIELTPVIEFYNRNALTWDDDRKIASFITAKDPDILEFAKNVTTWIKDAKNPWVDDNIQKGMALLNALKSYGISYEVDPATPFAELSEQKSAIDFLQFPRQTLQYTNGDCDDLTALYTSLLEAVGVETAVITTPGHIYGAFALKTLPSEAKKIYSNTEEFILSGNKMWLPVEITMIQDSFEKAWQTGALEWRENKFKNQAALFPTRESWNTFQAVGFKGWDLKVRKR